MIIYYVLFAVLIFFRSAIPLRYHGRYETVKDDQEKDFLIVIFIMLWLLYGLRSPSVGTDISHYLDIYKQHLYGSGWQIFTNSEWGYTLINNALSYFVPSQIYLALIGMFMNAILCYFMWKNSQEHLVSILLHIGIGLFAFFFSGIRQSLAICITLLAYQAAKEQKLFRFLVIIGVAMLFHNSAICVLPIYFLMRFRKVTRMGSMIMICGVLAAGVLSSFVIIVIQVVANDKYNRLVSTGNGVNYKSFILYFGLLVLCSVILFYENSYIEGTLVPIYLMAMVTAVIYIVAPKYFLFDRLGFYYIPYSILLVANTIGNMKNATTRRVAIAIMILFSVFWFSVATPGGEPGIDHYKFFWN